MKVLIVGCGKIAQLHARHLLKFGYKLDCYSRDAVKAETFALRLGTGATGHSGSSLADLQKLIASGQYTAVWICTPPAAHLAVLEFCFSQNIKVFCEKPVISNPAELTRLEALLAKRDLCFVGENYLYKPVVAWLKAQSLRWDLGAVTAVSLKKCFWQESRDWRQSESPMLEGGVHFAALAFEIAGVTEIEAFDYRIENNAGYYRSFAQHLRRPLTLQVEYSWNQRGALPAGIGQKSSVQFERGRAVLESNGLAAAVIGNGKYKASRAFLSDVGGFGGMYVAIDRWLRGDLAPSSHLSKAILALKLSGL